jgi:site-specific recombinase XerD
MQELEVLENQAFLVGKIEVLPTAILQLGAQGQFAWEEFFAAQIRNKHTRAAYLHAVKSFLTWIEPQEPQLARITPGMVGRYFDQLEISVPTKKLRMSAIRGFFDVLVLRHICLLNPALSVRTERYSVSEGKTPEISAQQSRQLLESIDKSTASGLRDKAIIATLIFTAVRAGAIAKLRMQDLVHEGHQYSLRFREKGGKQRAIPVRHDLQVILFEYLDLVGVVAAKDTPLFRSMSRKGVYSERGLSGVDVCRLVKRRLRLAELPIQISPHSFRSCTATNLLLQGTPLEDVQYLLGHSDSRITKLYDRRQRQVTRNIVERISV